MDSGLILELGAILVLVLANGVFALAEFSIVSSRASRLAQKVRQKKWGSRRAQRLRSRPERFLASIQVGITLVAALLGVFSGATVVAKLQRVLTEAPWTFVSESAKPIAMVAVVLAITVLSVVLGELVPKYIALSHPERYARVMAGTIGSFIRITDPFARLLSGLADLIVRLLGVKRIDSDHVSEDEINQMLHDGRKSGVFDDTEQEFVRSVFDFSDSTVSRALTPRLDVVAIDLSAKSDAILKMILDEGYSRYPVYEETIDHVVGIIYTKDLINPAVDLGNIDLSQLIRKPLFVPDSLPLTKLLREFQKGKAHIAIVLDEYGGTAGIITLEDILEELVGEILDEYDAEAPPIAQQSPTRVYANGDVWPGDINELIDSHLPEEDHDTLAGMIMEALGRLPDKHEALSIADVRLTILTKDSNRILRVKLDKRAEADKERS